MENQKYSASLTGEPLQFFESKVVAQFLTKRLSFEEIKSKIYDENLFNYKTKKSVFKRVASVYRRLKNLDPFLIELVAEASSADARVVVLYSIMRTNRLFYEFMTEVVRIKFLQMDYLISTKDLNRFFEGKKEQSQEITHLHEYTIHKLEQVLLKILKETSLLSEESPPMLQRIIISNNLREFFLKNNEKIFLECIGD